MKSTKGNPAVHVTQEMVKDAFLRVGAKRGDTVIFHGSLSSMGTVDGGVPAVYNGVLDAVGPSGTVAMPSLYYNGKEETRHPELFDLKTSPTYVGALAEGFRQDPRSIRSNNWTHSVNAIGARAEELCADHGASGLRPCPWNEGAFAECSPWQKLVDWNALYCFIGVDLNACTLKHLIESFIVMHLLDKVPVEKRAELRAELPHDCLPGKWEWPYIYSDGLMQILKADGSFCETTLGCTWLLAIRSQTLVQRVLEIVEPDLDKWVREGFLGWRDRCIQP